MVRPVGAAVALVICAHAYSATCTWTGLGADNNWGTAANWDTCVGVREVPIDTDTLIFPDSAPRKANTNNLVNLKPSALQLNGLNYDISGNAITLTTGISVNTPVGGFSDLGPRFRPDITLAGTQTFSCAAGKFLYIDGDVNLNGKDLGIDGACNTTLRGAVYGSGDIKKFGTGSLYLQAGTYTYGGITTINNGAAYVGTDAGLGATASSTYVAAGGTLSLYLGITLAESLFIEGGTLENFLGDNTVTGDVKFSLGATADVLPGTTLTIDGLASGGMNKEGTGTLVLHNSTVGMSVNAGVVEATGSSMGVVAVGTGGTFYGSGALTGALAVGASGTLSPGTRSTPGTLLGLVMSLDPGGYIRARLGKKSDRLTLSNSLAKASAGFCRFKFADGITPPQPGVEYTLVDFALQDGCDAGSLTYTYEGTGPGANLSGSFSVSATKITFTVSSVVSDLVFRNGLEP